MTESWYNECQKYDYHNPSYQPGTGHFTQVVWKGSQEVGFAQAKGASMTYAVAMYYPPGNYVGDFDRNVFPPQWKKKIRVFIYYSVNHFSSI